MQISDFKLALNGQIYDSEGLLYSYPEKITQLRAAGQYPAWINALQSDSRFLRELVNPGGECFSVRYSKEGLYYSYTKYNPHDARNGVASIALYAQNKAVSNPKQLMNVLRNLMDYFLEKSSVIGIVDAEVENLLKDMANPYSFQLPTIEATSSMDAYRIYQTEDELQNWLYCAIQKEYTHYKWVHFISATNRKAVINPTLYSELRGRVIECYAIKRGEGYELALSGSTCSLTFTREGYMPQKVTFIVGQPSQYVNNETNNVILPKQLSELHLTFKKKVTIMLVDESSGMPIVEDGRQICITEELMENTPKRVRLYAEGYQQKTITLDPSKITKAEGSMREALKRDFQSYKPSKNNQVWGIDDGEEKGVSMNIFIIFLVVAVISGAVAGFFVHKFAFASESTTKVVEIPSSHSDNSKEKSYVAQIDSLNGAISDQKEANENLLKQIEEMEGKIRELNGLLANRGQNELEKKANKYLVATKDQWCVQGMKNACKKGEEFKNTDAYKFLLYLLEADKFDQNRLDFVLSYNLEGNTKWSEIVAKMKEKKMAGASVDQFAQALKKANTAYNKNTQQLRPRQKFEDGTLKLGDLLTYIKAISL